MPASFPSIDATSLTADGCTAQRILSHQRPTQQNSLLRAPTHLGGSCSSLIWPHLQCKAQSALAAEQPALHGRLILENFLMPHLAPRLWHEAICFKPLEHRPRRSGELVIPCFLWSPRGCSRLDGLSYCTVQPVLAFTYRHAHIANSACPAYFLPPQTRQWLLPLRAYAAPFTLPVPPPPPLHPKP